jgi:hypothetical protein
MRLLLALSLIVLPVPALAGQRAVYVDPNGRNLAIDISDDGNAIIRPEGEQQFGVSRDGHFYLVAQEEGSWKVARIEDVAAAFDQVLPPIFKSLFASNAAAQTSRLQIDAKGRRKVGQFEGDAYDIHWSGEGSTAEPDHYVVSKDPELQPVGMVMEKFLSGTTLLMAPFLGEEAAEAVKDIRAVFAYGTPIEISGKFRLASIEQADIPAAATVLPAEPQTVEQIVASLKASMPEARNE